jgi:hypothetical protein
MRGRFIPVKIGHALIVAAILVIYGFEAHARRHAMPLPAMRSDQAAYLQYAKQIRESGYTFVGDRNRMPVFPFLLSLIYRPGMSEQEFLTVAQSFNVNLTIILLLLLFLIWRRFFPYFYSIALLVATAFGVFIYRAGVVQVEPLFYFISFAAFLFLLRMLTAPTYLVALLGGATCGLAFLTKASALAALAIWGVIFLTQCFVSTRRSAGFHWRGLVRRLLLGALLITSFVLSVFPYIWTSRQRYGQFFYNVNSAHYMWCDSWPEALSYTDKLQNPAARAAALNELPSFKKYWRTHSSHQVLTRFLRGLESLSTRSIKAVGYYKFVAFLALVALVLIVKNQQRFWNWLVSVPAAAIFCFLFFGVYVMLYAWYGAVVTDSRFVLMLFLPFTFSASIVVCELARDRVIALGRLKYPAISVAAAALIALAFIDVAYNAARIVQARRLDEAA